MKRILVLAVFFVLFSSTYLSADVKVLVLAGNVSQAEFPVLQKFTDVEGEEVSYEQTKDRTLPNLNKADILWIGQGEICENAYFFDQATEDKIKDFVNKGGIVISVGQDSDGGRPCEIGWLPKDDLVLGIERPGVETFEITDEPEAGELFSDPMYINLRGQIGSKRGKWKGESKNKL